MIEKGSVITWLGANGPVSGVVQFSYEVTNRDCKGEEYQSTKHVVHLESGKAVIVDGQAVKEILPR